MNLVLDATKECSAAMDFYRGAFATTNANVDAHTGYALLQRCRARLARLLAWFATVTGLASAVASTTAIARRSRVNRGARVLKSSIIARACMMHTM